MPNTIEFDSQTSCVVARFTGLLTLERLMILSGEAAVAMSENDSERMLIDLRGALIKLSVSDFYSLAQQLRQISSGYAHWACAFVVPNSAQSKFQFYEVVAGNQSLKAKSFLDTVQAKKWLREIPVREKIQPVSEGQ